MWSSNDEDDGGELLLLLVDRNVFVLVFVFVGNPFSSTSMLLVVRLMLLRADADIDDVLYVDWEYLLRRSALAGC